MLHQCPLCCAGVSLLPNMQLRYINIVNRAVHAAVLVERG